MRGWQVWYDQALEGRRRANLLRASAARLTKPKLAACVALWRGAWEEANRAAVLATAEGRMRAQIAELTAELAAVTTLRLQPRTATLPRCGKPAATGR